MNLEQENKNMFCQIWKLVLKRESKQGNLDKISIVKLQQLSRPVTILKSMIVACHLYNILPSCVTDGIQSVTKRLKLFKKTPDESHLILERVPEFSTFTTINKQGF